MDLGRARQTGVLRPVCGIETVSGFDQPVTTI